MADDTNVVEVNFKPRRTQVELIDEVIQGTREVRDGITAMQGLAHEATQIARDVIASRDWYERNWRIEARAARRLERELVAERRARFPFTDEQVFVTLETVTADGPVRASVVAAALFPGQELPHGLIIRVGFALARLLREGRVTRVVSGGRDECGDPIEARRGYEWEPVDA